MVTGIQHFISPETSIESFLLTGKTNPKTRVANYISGKIDFNSELEEDKKKLLRVLQLEQSKLPLKIGRLISNKGILGNGFSYVLPLISSSETDELKSYKLGMSEYNRFLGQNFTVPTLGETNLGTLEYDRKTEQFNLGFYYMPQSQLEEEVIRQSELKSKYNSFSGKIELVQKNTSHKRRGLILLVNEISEIQKVTANVQKYLTRQLK